MSSIAIDGLGEEDFRRSIEMMLRRGDFDRAAERLRTLLVRYAGVGKILPPQFLRMTANHLSIAGWETLSERLARHDRPGHPITALSICFGHPPEAAPAASLAVPWFETTYYSDDAYAFSQSTRDDLLDGYSSFGCTWTGDCEASDTALSLAGIEEMHGAIARLEARLHASEMPDREEIRAGSIAACYLSVLLFQVLRDTVARNGLPRPVCVMAGSNGVYPYFDAPVTGIEEDEGRRYAEAGLGAGRMVPPSAPQYASLLMSAIPRAKKRAVLVLEESADEAAERIAELCELPQAEVESAKADAEVELSALLARHFPGASDPALQHPEAPSEPAPEQVALEPLADLHDLLKPKPEPDDGWNGGGHAPAPGFELLAFRKQSAPAQTCIRFQLDKTIFAETLSAMAVPDDSVDIDDEPPQPAYPPEAVWPQDVEPAEIQPPPPPPQVDLSRLAPPLPRATPRRRNSPRRPWLATFGHSMRAMIGRWRR